MKIQNSKWIKLALLAGIPLLIAIMMYDLFPLFKELAGTHGDEREMVNYISAYGSKGIFVILVLQILQVIVTLVPAAPIQVLAGLCYGFWLGSLICIVGYLAGNVLVFTVLRRFKQSFLAPRQQPKKVAKKQSKWIDAEKIKQMKNPEFIAFLLYLIPGIPNGILPYIFAQTPISFRRYFASITIASIPSVLLCTLIGKCISQHNYLLAVALSAVMLLSLLILFIFRNKIMAKINTMGNA